MKKNILAVAIAGAMAVPFAANASAPTLYGQMNIAVDSVTDNGSAVVNRNSRLGVKGSEDVGNGLKVVYQFETTLVANGGDNGGFGGQRNTFVGVAGGFGTVIAGRHDTPLRMIQPNDRFNDSAYLGNNTGRFGGLNLGGDANFSGEDRVDNVVVYISPNINGFQVSLAGITDAEEPKNQALGNGYSASLSYGSKRNGLYAAIGLTQATKDLYAAGENIDQQNTRAVVQYSDAGLVVSAMYNGVNTKKVEIDGERSDLGNHSNIVLGAAYTMGDFTPRAKVAFVSYDDIVIEDEKFKTKDATNYTIGLDYALGKKTRTFVEYGVLDKNSLSGVRVNDKSTDVFTVGIAHSF
ncbi:porin [Thiomicrospira cyclica]|uniref:Porin Gram-negative type n=1 Tax=Thiomicrospira cyclica (strain DSM 14477 / JCM 11371 / ALM1) TaxID=717773 RepID=F6D938_THICA|nr:porin [Thiomicrospira cyclica]AEG30869.1 porin Gram-negative type [Thiomicrospira cyclica ALM1]